MIRGGLPCFKGVGIEVGKYTDASIESRNSTPYGCAHPPVKSTQLLRKLLESSVSMSPDGSIPRSGWREVPRVVPLEKVGQKVLLIIR